MKLSFDSDPGSGCVDTAVVSAVHPLALDHPEEPFPRCIVAAMTRGAHAAHKVVASKELLVLLAGKLRAVIRVQDDGLAAIVSLPKRISSKLRNAKRVQGARESSKPRVANAPILFPRKQSIG